MRLLLIQSYHVEYKYQRSPNKLDACLMFVPDDFDTHRALDASKIYLPYIEAVYPLTGKRAANAAMTLGVYRPFIG